MARWGRTYRKYRLDNVLNGTSLTTAPSTIVNGLSEIPSSERWHATVPLGTGRQKKEGSINSPPLTVKKCCQNSIEDLWVDILGSAKHLMKSDSDTTGCI
jgi:hypothetical protein